MVCSLCVVYFFMKEKEEERGKVAKICDNNNNNKTILSCCLCVEGALLLLHCSGGPLSVCLSLHFLMIDFAVKNQSSGLPLCHQQTHS